MLILSYMCWKIKIKRQLQEDFLVRLPTCRNRKAVHLSELWAADSRTNGGMSEFALWVTLTFLPVPTTTCHGSDCQPLLPAPLVRVSFQLLTQQRWMFGTFKEKQNCYVPTKQLVNTTRSSREKNIGRFIPENLNNKSAMKALTRHG